MDAQDNQDETDEGRSLAPNLNTMLLYDGDHFEPTLNTLTAGDGHMPSESESELKSSRNESDLLLFPQQKWSRLRQYYDDHYLELFRMDTEGSEDVLGTELPATQLGASTWDPAEKAALFKGLCRNGRRNLQAISESIGSKSVVEVKAYLDNLQEHEIDRQLFEPQTKNMSHTKIPAAIEVGPECEKVLERAADALAAFQEQYDHAAGQRLNPIWLIDHATALEFEQKADEEEATDGVCDNNADENDQSASEAAVKLFHLPAFLALSEQFFLNQGSDGWHNVAEDGQKPALTMDVVTNFYDIILNFTRRLVQTCLVLAQSRIRASTTTDYKPSKLVRYEDATAALSVLNVKNNSETFWVEMARRNKLSVVDDSHRKENSRRAVLSYREVESRLGEPRRRRSMSATSEDSMQSRASSIGSASSSEENSGQEDAVIGTNEEESVSYDEGGYEETSSSSDEQNRSPSPDHATRSTAPMSKQERAQLLQETEDEYMERMDQAARKLEESRLLQLLDAQFDDVVKPEESEGLGPRPKVLRKTVQECRGWSIPHPQAEWERDGTILPAEEFAEVGHRAKRRRLEVGVIAEAE
ncbi:hypothetical protein ABEF93_001611 [Exophiala dermatitidis]